MPSSVQAEAWLQRPKFIIDDTTAQLDECIGMGVKHGKKPAIQAQKHGAAGADLNTWVVGATAPRVVELASEASAVTRPNDAPTPLMRPKLHWRRRVVFTQAALLCGAASLSSAAFARSPKLAGVPLVVAALVPAHEHLRLGRRLTSHQIQKHRLYMAGLSSGCLLAASVFAVAPKYLMTLSALLIIPTLLCVDQARTR